MSRIDCNEIVKRMEERLSADYQIELHEASTVQLHNALAEAVMAVTAKDCRESRRAHERVRILFQRGIFDGQVGIFKPVQLGDTGRNAHTPPRKGSGHFRNGGN